MLFCKASPAKVVLNPCCPDAVELPSSVPCINLPILFSFFINPFIFNGFKLAGAVAFTSAEELFTFNASLDEEVSFSAARVSFSNVEKIEVDSTLANEQT